MNISYWEIQQSAKFNVRIMGNQGHWTWWLENTGDTHEIAKIKAFKTGKMSGEKMVIISIHARYSAEVKVMTAVERVTGCKKLPWAFLKAQLVKNPPARKETPVRFLGWDFCWRGNKLSTPVFLDFLVAQLVKNLPAIQETWVWFLDWEDPLEKGKAFHSNVLAWRIPWESDVTFTFLHFQRNEAKFNR